MNELLNLRFISKKDEWYDENTEARLICLTGTGRLGSPSGPRSVGGLFQGYRDGGFDQEVCSFTEFEIVDEAYFSCPEAKNVKRIMESDVY